MALLCAGYGCHQLSIISLPCILSCLLACIEVLLIWCWSLATNHNILQEQLYVKNYLQTYLWLHKPYINRQRDQGSHVFATFSKNSIAASTAASSPVHCLFCSIINIKWHTVAVPYYKFTDSIHLISVLLIRLGTYWINKTSVVQLTCDKIGSM
jgi:hypothetical protein